MNAKDSKNLPVVSDGYTKVLPVTTSNIVLKSPMLLAGFPDSGFIGSVSVNHIIEEQRLHQIAYIESQYVMPAAIFIGKRFRHAFRIYANDAGTICALICEMPVNTRGTYSITNAIVEWCANAGVRGIIVLGGILPANFSPPYLLERKPMLLRNEFAGKLDDNNRNVVDNPAISGPDDAVIVGLAGSLLSVSAIQGLDCSALMVPTIADSADPEGAAIVLEALTKVLPGLKIDTSSIRRKVELIKKQMEDFLRMHQHHKKEYEQSASRETERIYK
jgi:uncharacterized protein